MSRTLTFGLFLVWLFVVAAGAGMLWRHAQTPGRPALAPARGPPSSRLPRPVGKATLVLFAHPHCPCTRATLSELARLMARCRPRLRAYVLFYRPCHVPAGWEVTDTYTQAMRIPGVLVLADEEGAEAGLFDAATSGQALLYDAQGRLVFSGGLTTGRGHEGDSAGQAAVFAVVSGQAIAVRNTPDFGCSLAESTSKTAQRK